MGCFRILPNRLLANVVDSEDALRLVTKEEYSLLRYKFDSSFKPYTHPAGFYGKVEHVFLDIPVNHTFFFYDQIPFIVFLSLFGDDELKVFTGSELKSAEVKKVTSTFHICTRERLVTLLTLGDVEFWKFISYVDVEVHHELCLFVTIKQLGQRWTGGQKYTRI